MNNRPEWPADPEVRKAGLALREFAWSTMCPAAFVYLVTGEKKYADVAWDIYQHMGKVNRWGWFPWDGANMPQIEAGMFFRNAAFTLDFIWDYLTPEQRRQAATSSPRKPSSRTFAWCCTARPWGCITCAARTRATMSSRER